MEALTLSTLFKFPDLVSNIVAWLPYNDKLFCMRRTCKLWKQIIESRADIRTSNYYVRLFLIFEVPEVFSIHQDMWKKPALREKISYLMKAGKTFS